MRKLLWYGLAALTAGVCGTGYYAYRYPHSVVGQCVYKAGELGLSANPVALMTRTMAGRTGLQEESLCCPMAEEGLPGEPTPVEDPAPAAEPLAGLLDLNPIMRVPAPIVIREDVDAGLGQAGFPMLDADNEVQSKGAQLPGGQTADVEQGHSHLRIMPYATNEADPKRMPYAGESGPGGPFDPEVFNQGPNALSSVAEELMRAFVEGLAENKSANGSSEEQEPKDTPMEGPGLENAFPKLPPNYHHYHDSDRYMVCPYSGKCVEIKPPSDSESKCKESDSEYELIPAPALEEEESEPKCKKKAECEKIPDIFMEEESETMPTPEKHSDKAKMMLHQSFKHSEIWPIHPEVDTMEFRPSDGSLYRYPKKGPY